MSCCPGYSPYDDRETMREEITSHLGTYRETSISGGTTRVDAILNPSIHHQRIEAMTTERDRIDRERISTTSLADEIKDNLDRVSVFPTGRNVIIVVLILNTLLFFIGVIYPLHFLPLSGEPSFCKFGEILSCFADNLLSLRGIILALISCIFVSINAIFIYRSYQQKVMLLPVSTL